MLLPSKTPSPSPSLSKFVYVIGQLRHSLVVHPLPRKIIDPPLLCTIGGGGGGVSPRKSVVQSACQYDVTSLVSDFQNGEQSVHRRNR